MKRIIMLLAATTLVGCGFAPEELEGGTAHVKGSVVVGCEGLDDAFVAGFIDLAAELTGNTNGVEAIRARRKALCAAAGQQPVDPVGELAPVAE